MCSKCGNRLLSLLLLSPAVGAAVPEIRERFTDLLPGADTTDSVRMNKQAKRKRGIPKGSLFTRDSDIQL